MNFPQKGGYLDVLVFPNAGSNLTKRIFLLTNADTNVIFILLCGTKCGTMEAI